MPLVPLHHGPYLAALEDLGYLARMSGGAFKVLGVLLGRVDRSSRSCMVGTEAIRQAIGVYHPRTVRAAVRELLNLQLLVRVAGGRGRGRASRYYFTQIETLIACRAEPLFDAAS